MTKIVVNESKVDIKKAIDKDEKVVKVIEEIKKVRVKVLRDKKCQMLWNTLDTDNFSFL